MSQHKRIDENKIFSMEREKEFPNSLVLEHCTIKFDERIISYPNDKDRNAFDLYRDDLEELFPTEMKLDEDTENLMYINLVLGTLWLVEYPYRKVFIMYQASKQSDPVAWLDNVNRVMTTHKDDIIRFANDESTFYYTSLALLSDARIAYMAHRKNDKMSVSWNGGPVQFVELILALYKMEYKVEYETGAKTENILKYDYSAIKDEKALISAMAHTFNFVIKDIYNYIESIKARKEIKGQEDKKARFLHKLIDSLIAYCRDSDSL